MGINMKWSVVLFCVIIWNALFGAAVGDIYPLTVEGVGTVTVPADIVTISVSVESSNENITQAQYEVGEEMNRVISALKKAGVKDEEILPGQGSGISSFQSSSKVCKTVNNTRCQKECSCHSRGCWGKPGKGHGYLRLSRSGNRLFLWRRLGRGQDDGCQLQGHGDL